MEQIPDGPLIVCANHTSNLDPLLVSMAAGLDWHIQYMAKRELFSVPIIGAVIKAVGAFSVDRDNNDVRAVKKAMSLLRKGDKVGIFPEGRRVLHHEQTQAKNGAVMIADKMSVKIMPVYVTEHKRLFGRIDVVFGTPYDVNPDRRKLTSDDYTVLADELMARIFALEPQKHGTRGQQ